MALKITLPDGNVLEMEAGASTLEVARRISEGLARAAVAGRFSPDGATFETIDLNRPLPGDGHIRILKGSDDDPEALLLLRHSTAHVMAEAICKLFPETKLTYGPPLPDGFYYDIDLPRSLSPEDFPRIEEEMARIVKENRPFTRVEVPREIAMGQLRREGNRYKVDNAERAEGDILSFYVTGPERGRYFEDLCRGPHLPNTGLIKAFKIRQVSGSYYRGDVNDQRLQRIYGTAFFKAASLKTWEEQLEQAKARDHRVIGKDLGLFTISPTVGSGLILWQPRGAIVRQELQTFLAGVLGRMGYEPVFTPHIGRLGMYRTSGHFPYYSDSQFAPIFETHRGQMLYITISMIDRALTSKAEADEVAAWACVRSLIQSFGAVEGITENSDSLEELKSNLDAAFRQEEGYLLKPMNCPHHIQIYASMPRSYKDLPIRLAEFGTVYRYEQSGELGGLTRVRGFTQDDAHLFCTSDQLAKELSDTVGLTRMVLETLGLSDYRVRLGLRDPSSPKYVGTPENWEKAEAAVREAVRVSGVEYSEEVGEAAFYGPKIDFVVKDCIGRSWQLGTVQVDYNLPQRFALTYIGSDNRPHQPVMIHRAPFGSMERFMGILIEHFAGAFPLWLSPVQVAVVTISEKSDEYARRVAARTKEAGLRVELDLSSEKIGPKKHRHRQMKTNYILVVGEKEAEEGKININDREGANLGTASVEAFLLACRKEIDTRGRETVASTLR